MTREALYNNCILVKAYIWWPMDSFMDSFFRSASPVSKDFLPKSSWTLEVNRGWSHMIPLLCYTAVWVMGTELWVTENVYVSACEARCEVDVLCVN